MLRQLSPRELQILKLTAKGHTNEQIAAELHLSLQTVKNHVFQIMDRLGAGNRTQALAIAVRDGIISLNPDNPMQLGRRIAGIELPQKYKLLEEFVLEMVHRMEAKEAKYGDWRDIDKDSIRGHLIDEFKELAKVGFESAEESVDLANLCAMKWALVNKYIIPKG